MSQNRFQGFNTGVVLYNLKAMWESSVYNRCLIVIAMTGILKSFILKIGFSYVFANSYLNPGAITRLLEEFMYSFTLAEQVKIYQKYLEPSKCNSISQTSGLVHKSWLPLPSTLSHSIMQVRYIVYIHCREEGCTSLTHS